MARSFAALIRKAGCRHYSVRMLEKFLLLLTKRWIFSERVEPSTFAAVTANCSSTSPISYIPPSSTLLRIPRRAPRDHSEDCWSLILFRGHNLALENTVNYALMESIGQWDERWGWRLLEFARRFDLNLKILDLRLECRYRMVRDGVVFYESMSSQQTLS